MESFIYFLTYGGLFIVSLILTVAYLTTAVLSDSFFHLLKRRAFDRTIDFYIHETFQKAENNTLRRIKAVYLFSAFTLANILLVIFIIQLVLFIVLSET